MNKILFYSCILILIIFLFYLKTKCTEPFTETINIKEDDATLVIKIENGNLSTIKETNKWESRHESTTEMIREINLPDGTYYVNTTDITPEGLFGYTGSLAIPDFAFLKWREVKLPDFYEFYDWTPSDFKTREDKMFWLGNITTHENRKIVHEGSKDNQFIDFNHAMPDTYKSDPNVFKSMYDHANYKYLLDIEGIGWSARLKFLLLTGSVVFIMDRPHVEYWHTEFTPWVHYIPIKRGDYTDLENQLNKVMSLPDKGESIGSACREKALEVFAKNRVYDRMYKIMTSVKQVTNT